MLTILQLQEKSTSADRKVNVAFCHSMVVPFDYMILC